MGLLSARDRELVSIGAALGSNCVGCIEFHIPAARKAGISDQEISEAVEVANGVRQVPAAKVLKAATAAIRKKGESTRKSCEEDDQETVTASTGSCCA